MVNPLANPFPVFKSRPPEGVRLRQPLGCLIFFCWPSTRPLEGVRICPWCSGWSPRVFTTSLLPGFRSGHVKGIIFNATLLLSLWEGSFGHQFLERVRLHLQPPSWLPIQPAEGDRLHHRPPVHPPRFFIFAARPLRVFVFTYGFLTGPLRKLILAAGPPRVLVFAARSPAASGSFIPES